MARRVAYSKTRGATTPLKWTDFGPTRDFSVLTFCPKDRRSNDVSRVCATRPQLTVKKIELELLDPGLLTTRVAVPVAPTSDAGIATIKCDESTKVVVRSAPFHKSTAPGTRFDPVTVIVRLPLPTVALEKLTQG